MGRGLAEGDLDNDGDVDFVVSNAGGPIQIFRNIAPKSGNSVSFRLVDPSLGGRDALGAEIVVAAGGRHHWGLVQTSFSYLSASDPRVHLGLGSASNYNSVRVIWPDGWEETFPAGTANREVLLARGRGQKQ